MIRAMCAELAAVFFLLGLSGCGKTPSPPPRQPPPAPLRSEPRESMQVRGGEIFLAGPEGEYLFRASAERIEGDFAKGEGKMIDVEARVVEKDIELVRAEAHEARYEPEGRQVILRGGVSLQWPEKSAKAEAEEMTWSLEERRIEARGGVDFRRGQESLQGEVLRADFGLSSIEVLDGGE